MEWEQNYGESEEDGIVDILETNNGYALLGWSDSKDHDVGGNYELLDIWVIKLYASLKVIPKIAYLNTCETDLDSGIGIFDLAAAKDLIRDCPSPELYWFEDVDGNNLIENYITADKTIYVKKEPDLCLSFTVILIIDPIAINTPVISGPTSVCPNNQQTYLISETAGVNSFLWDKKNKFLKGEIVKQLRSFRIKRFFSLKPKAVGPLIARIERANSLRL